MNRPFFGASALAIGVLTFSAVSAQTPQQQMPTKNLQVLPKNLTVMQVAPMMQEIAAALGVTCEKCHVERENAPAGAQGLAAFDFASDAKPEKKIARTMLLMTRGINEKLGAELGKKPDDVTQVRCVTCHRGFEVPSATPRTTI